ncbi:EF hand domain containing protein [Nitzschia inconspicua]|uniref:EF hand domain containing protein n=1 Tax=Nitzschia inconspicua TaxID=303405 RepID=A0A9K3K4F5_9STRA|nr:EF hand domain containing protein [Nitzschia inconspicua]KAG7347652.1 EF hand domain containing protein [Nitzschia inconspicua]
MTAASPLRTFFFACWCCFSGISVVAVTAAVHEFQTTAIRSSFSVNNGIFSLRGGDVTKSEKNADKILLVGRTTPSGFRDTPWIKKLASLHEGKASERDSVSSSPGKSSSRLGRTYNPLRMYVTCLTIVSIWITTGTLFYAICNDWPIPQSFFYAVDAGMSIGFCTDVVETKLVSKAFTILYILLGASVVGGALALFIQDAIEGIHDNQHDTKEYQLLLEQKVFEKFNVSRSGALNLEEFRQLLQASTKAPLSERDIAMLWSKFDRLKDGVIHFEEFAGTYRGIESLIASLHDAGRKTVMSPIWFSSTVQFVWYGENRIYFVFVAWVLLGVVWGMLDQGWDPITSTHFAVSALATGGLTAPRVNSEGILPAEPAIFCGLYCLLGIPLMAVTLGHFARALVSGQVAAMERDALTRPITATEYNVAKQNLTVRASGAAKGLNLGDFVVLQLMRQGRLSVQMFEVLKKEFEMLDKDQTGMLSLREATNCNLEDEDREADK